MGQIMKVQDIIKLAEKHVKVTGNTSAAICLQDAKSMIERGFDNYARVRALDSLKHSVGVFHSDYKKALEN
ncbi:hypothetical protein [Ralstonia phage RSP15]|uniref:hypothetical protein n=1 Tax=Ralstonia phage RSP15 TaxID=1785960 RepID=UPI00074D4BD6|nr:hypothetical protein BH754_gp152 [Ralstonia phage RSP15]BAU40154.1 hypothetical protein [Ralstonia phage RSP15]